MRNKLYCIVLLVFLIRRLCRFVLTNEQCKYTQYLYKGSVVAKLCHKSIIEITISLRPELK